MKRFEFIKAYFMVIIYFNASLLLTFYTVREYVERKASFPTGVDLKYEDITLDELKTELVESKRELSLFKSLFKKRLAEIQKELIRADSFVKLNGHLEMGLILLLLYFFRDKTFTDLSTLYWEFGELNV